MAIREVLCVCAQVNFNLGVAEGLVSATDIDWREVCRTVATCHYMGACYGEIAFVTPPGQFNTSSYE